jgi:hypothetical protein
VDLTNWRIRKGVDFDFTDGDSISAGQTLVVISFDPDKPENADRLAAFQWEYGVGPNVRMVGGYSGQLDDGGERIQLQRPDSPPTDEPNFIPRLFEDEVFFDDLEPWPIEADGTGKSLGRSNIRGYGNAASSWSATDPSPGEFDPGMMLGDFNDDGIVDERDIDLLAAAIVRGDATFDLTGDHKTDAADHTYLIETIIGVPFGDSNLDGIFNSTDLIQIFQAGEYEDGVLANSTWSTGDWNGDQEFDSGDLVKAFQAGAYVP